MAVVNNLKKVRTAHDVKQEELAVAIGAHPKSISIIEHGERNVSLEMALRLSHYFKCSVEDLFEVDDVINN